MQILNLSATINVASLNPSINTYRLGEGAGTYEYPELNNKPQINGVTLVGNILSANLGIKTSDLTNDSGYISEADIPTATSDLVNDSGFVNSTQVQSVVSDAIPSDISYFNNDVGYITNADIGNIPTRTSQLVNDSGYITAAEAPVVSVNNMTGAVVLDGSNIEYEQNLSLNSKIDTVEDSIPTTTSELTNDSGFITNASIPTRTSQLVNDSGFVNSQNIPVQSVNGETGAVELTADNIPYDSENSIAEKIDNLTAEDLSYDGGADTVWDKVESLKNSKIIAQAVISDTPLTTTASAYNTVNSRKFSDYDLLVFKLGNSVTDTRRTVVLPSNIWSSGWTINEGVLHGSTVSTPSSYQYSSFSITYKSDTSITASVNGSATITHLAIYGLKLST